MNFRMNFCRGIPGGYPLESQKAPTRGAPTKINPLTYMGVTKMSQVIERKTLDELRQILAEAKTIAVVGLSDKADRPSYGVAAYLQEQGFRIIPVNPTIAEVLGEKAYASLRDI